LRTYTKAGLIFSAILISCACIHGADTIELPFDYFYGRWTTGHFLDGRVAIVERDPQGRTDYSYTSNRIQVGLDDIQEYLVVSQQVDYVLRTPTLFLYHRPSPNWQISLDTLRYHETPSNIILYEPPDVFLSSVVDRHLDMSMTSHWLNRQTLKIPHDQARFVYRIQPVFGSGQAAMSTRIRLHHKRSSRSIYRNDRLWGWTLENSLRRGVGGDLSLALGLNFKYSIRDIDKFTIIHDYSSDPIVRSGSFERAYEPGYHANAQYIGLNPVYLELGVAQEFWWSDKELHAITTQSSDFQENRTSAFLNAYYITQGEFDPNIVLDDYNGFYHHMLFHNQFQVAFNSRYQKYGRTGTVNYELESLELSASYGWWNRVEVGLAGSYERQLFPFRNPFTLDPALARVHETVSTAVTVKYRSYTYRPGEGPGWLRDNRYDILFGATPQFGQVYIEAKYSPPDHMYLGDQGPVGFLALKNLQRNDRTRLEVETSLGLGRTFVVTSNHLVLYTHGSLFYHHFGFDLRRRVRNIELSLNYQQLYWNSNFDDVTIIGRLRILL